MKRNILTATVITVLVLVGLAVYWQGVVKPPAAGKAEIYVILAESGPADFIGKPERKVLDLLVAEYSANRGQRPPIELIFRDTGGKPEEALKWAREAASRSSVVAIIGPSTSGESIAVAKDSDALEIPVLSLAASRQIVVDTDAKSERPRRWMFKFAQNDDLAAKRLGHAMRRNGHAKIALLSSDDGFGKSGAAEFRRFVKDNPEIRLVHDIVFSKDIDSADSLIASLPRDADGILIWCTSPAALLAKGMRSAGLRTQIYLSHGNASADFAASAGIAGEGAIIIGSRVLLRSTDLSSAEPADAVISQFQKFWATNIGGLPSHFGGHARDAFFVLVEAASAEHAPTRLGIRRQLETLGKTPGVTGVFDITGEDHAGLGINAFATYRITSGEFIRIQDGP